MNLTARDIDWIVAEVVRRLTEHNLSGGRQPTESATLPDRIITLDTLKKHGKQTELVVSPRAIITPAARDELKQRGVRIVRGEAATATHNKTTNKQLLAANLGADYRHETLAQLVAPYGVTLAPYQTSLMQSQLEQVVRDQCRAVWFAADAARTACLANRNERVFAMVGHDAQTVTNSLKSSTTNILVIDPHGKHQYNLRQIIAAFVSH